MTFPCHRPLLLIPSCSSYPRWYRKYDSKSSFSTKIKAIIHCLQREKINIKNNLQRGKYSVNIIPATITSRCMNLEKNYLQHATIHQRCVWQGPDKIDLILSCWCVCIIKDLKILEAIIITQKKQSILYKISLTTRGNILRYLKYVYTKYSICSFLVRPTSV